MKKNSKYIRFIIKISLIILLLNLVKTTFFSWGQIEIVVYNNTFSDQKIWLTPKNKYTYDIREGKKEKIKYSIDDLSISLLLNYYNNEGKSEEIVLSEYVEKQQQGKIIVEMNQLEENGEILLEVTNKIK